MMGAIFTQRVSMLMPRVSMPPELRMTFVARLDKEVDQAVPDTQSINQL